MHPAPSKDESAFVVRRACDCDGCNAGRLTYFVTPDGWRHGCGQTRLRMLGCAWCARVVGAGTALRTCTVVDLERMGEWEFSRRTDSLAL